MCLKTSEVVIGIFVTLYLTGICRCLYIPSKSNDLIKDIVDAGKGEKKIQICGDTLTNLLETLCRGNFNKMSPGGTSSDDSKLTELCCKKQCSMGVLFQFCADPPPQFHLKSLRPISNDIQNHPNELDVRPSRRMKPENVTTRTSMSRINEIRNPERNDTVLPLQVETIPPNFESLGAMPLVVP